MPTPKYMYQFVFDVLFCVWQRFSAWWSPYNTHTAAEMGHTCALDPTHQQCTPKPRPQPTTASSDTWSMMTLNVGGPHLSVKRLHSLLIEITSKRGC